MAKRTVRKKPIRRDSAAVRFDYHALGDDMPVQCGEFFTHRTNMRGFDEEIYIALDETERTITARRVILTPDRKSPTRLKWSPTGLECLFQRSDCSRAQLTNPAAYATVQKVPSNRRHSWLNDIHDTNKAEQREFERLQGQVRAVKPKNRTCFDCFDCTKMYGDRSCKKLLSPSVH